MSSAALSPPDALDYLPAIMSCLARLVATLLVSLLALMPGLPAAAAPQDCGMVDMRHATQVADMGAKALPAICKVQCQVPALLPMPDNQAQATSLPLRFAEVTPPRRASRSNPPEAPPPRS